MTKRSPSTQQAINLITAAVYKPLGMRDWKKFTEQPPETQAHYLCEAYLATLRDRSLPGKKVEVNVLDEFTPAALREKALEAANKLHPLLEMPITSNKLHYTRRPKLLQSLRAFHMGTSYILHLNPVRYDTENQEHLRKVASSAASGIALNWFTTEMRSDGWVTIRKKTQRELRRELSKARPTSRPVGSRSMPRTTSALLRAELEAFFKSSVPRITFEPAYYEILTGHILRDRVSVLASTIAKGAYTTKITSDDIVVLEKKGHVVAPVAPVAPVVAPVVEPDEYSYRNLRDDVANFFTQTTFSSKHLFTYDYDNCHDLPDGIFRDKVSSLAHSIAPGKYTTKIADLYGNVVLTKKA